MLALGIGVLLYFTDRKILKFYYQILEMIFVSFLGAATISGIIILPAMFLLGYIAPDLLIKTLTLLYAIIFLIVFTWMLFKIKNSES